MHDQSQDRPATAGAERLRELGRSWRGPTVIGAAVLLATVVLAACAKDTDDGDDKGGGHSTKQEQATPAQAPPAAPIDWKALDQAMTKAGSAQPGEVYKFAFPRTDLKVIVDGVQLQAALALGSWVAFRQTGTNTAIAMGDLVLVEGEVAPVIRKLQEGGVEQTALHNHLLRESPRVLYMHIHARGDPVKIAAAIHDALVLTKTPFAAPVSSAPPAPAPRVTLDTAAITAVLGQSGKLNGVVYQVSVPRAETIKDGATEIPPAMGVATAINIQPTGAGTAAATGDFVLTGAEVNPVIHALTQNGIAITALHSHMLTDDPHLFFMHFWTNEDVASLTRGLRAALDRTNSRGQTASR
jgi:Domain of Unknown Function (DUF1259)